MAAGHYIWRATGSIPLSPTDGKFRVKVKAPARSFALPTAYLAAQGVAPVTALGSGTGIFDNGGAAPSAAGSSAAGGPAGSRMEP